MGFISLRYSGEILFVRFFSYLISAESCLRGVVFRKQSNATTEKDA